MKLLSDTPLNPPVDAPRRPAAWEPRLRVAAWPIAVILIAHAIVKACNGTFTDDFTTVYQALERFHAGAGVYEQAYNHVDPLYLYNPGTTLLLAPLAMLDFELARTLFILVNAAAIIGALAIFTRLSGHQLRGAVFPTAVALAFATEAVTNTLTFTNINGLLLLTLAVFLWAFLHRRGELAGVVIGLAILVKPQFAPLLALPAVKRDWRTLAFGIATPVVINALAWRQAPGYLDSLAPYLAHTRDYANSSWPGVRAYFDLSPVLYYPVWLLGAALATFALLALLRWHHTDPTLWALSSTGVIFAGIFFLSSLGQQYYSMWLFPLLFTVLMPHSIMSSAPAWLGAGLALMPLSWANQLWPTAGRLLDVFLATAGWFILLVAAAAACAGWWARERDLKAALPAADAAGGPGTAKMRA